MLKCWHGSTCLTYSEDIQHIWIRHRLHRTLTASATNSGCINVGYHRKILGPDLKLSKPKEQITVATTFRAHNQLGWSRDALISLLRGVIQAIVDNGKPVLVTVPHITKPSGRSLAPRQICLPVSSYAPNERPAIDVRMSRHYSISDATKETRPSTQE